MKSINLQRTESLLLELIPEALSNLMDNRINSLPITAINCKNGKYDAIVYFDGSDFDKNEIKEYLLVCRFFCCLSFCNLWAIPNPAKK